MYNINMCSVYVVYCSVDIFLVDAGDGGTYEVKVEDGKLYYNRKWCVLYT